MRICLLTIIALLISGSLYAETIRFKNGEEVVGKILSENDRFIKAEIDLGFAKPTYVYYLDEIAAIDDRTIDVQLSSPVVQQTGDRIFTDEDYGLELKFPEGWHVVVGQERIKQRIRDIRSWQSLDFPVNPKCDPRNLKYAKNIANVIAEELSFAMTPFYAAYPVKPENFYQQRRPIPEIKFKIKPARSARPLAKEMRTANMIASVIGGTFLQRPQIQQLWQHRALSYALQYEEDSDIGQVVKMVFVVTHDGKAFALELLSKAENYQQHKVQFYNVIKSLSFQ